MAAAGVEADEYTYATLIKTHSYCGDLESALKVREAMQAANFTPTPRIWGSLFLACAGAQQLEMASILWWEAKQLQGAGGGEQLNTDNLNAMMTACNQCYQVGVRGGCRHAQRPTLCAAALTTAIPTPCTRVCATGRARAEALAGGA